MTSTMLFHPKRILVTGGAGFIGTNFILYMLEKHPDIIIFNLDKLTYAVSPRNLSALENMKRHYMIEGDVADRALVDEILRENRIDTIVHFAAESHVDRSIQTPEIFIKTNVAGTFSVLDAAKQYWLDEKGFSAENCRFHHISTDEVYGSLSKEDPPFTELSRYDPSSPYSASKAASDHLVNAYNKTYALPTTTSNCSNNFGPFQHVEKFIPTVISACRDLKPIPIYGDGSNIRDWIYVGDHCQMIDSIIRYGKTGETYNVGGNCEISNLSLAKKICEYFNENRPMTKPYESLIQFVDDRAGHDWRYAISNQKIENELAHAKLMQSSDLRMNLTNTINWYEN